MRLRGTRLRLAVQPEVSEDGNGCHAHSYTYRLQEEDDERSWLVRWEYERVPPHADHRYPAAHVHVNATFRPERAAAWIAKTAGHLHLPTERVPLESVVWHVIAEWGAEPRAGDWRERLGASVVGFRARLRGG